MADCGSAMPTANGFPRAGRLPIANRTSRPGFSLLEAVLSSIIMAVILLGIVSIFRLAGGALSASAATTYPQAGEAVDQIAADVSLAQSFSERTTTAITMAVPDRDGDGQPETIRYSWAGTAGAPLLRQLNGGTAVALASDVRHFNLNYVLRTVQPDAAGAPDSLQDNTLYMEHDDVPGGSLLAYTMGQSAWCAQYFKPTLPAGTVSWSITRVAFCARKEDNPHGNLIVEIRNATASLLPGSTIIASAQISEQAFSPHFTWMTLDLTGATNLDPAKGYVLVIKYGSGSGKVGSIEYESGGSPMTPDSHFMTSSNAGATWSAPNSTQDMMFRVYGVVSKQ